MRILLVDDEEPARQRMRRMLARHPGIEVVAEAGDAEQALRWVELAQPDVVFLDIRMPGLDGISFAQRYQDLPPIVFVTAHDAHAIEAFEVNAVDYLLKPVRNERLAATLDRLRARGAAGTAATARVFAALGDGDSSARIVSRAHGTVRLFDARNVTRFWAAHKYTVFLADGAEQLTEESLALLEQRLAAHAFLRVHRADLVNLRRVKALVGSDGACEIELDDAQRVRVSRRMLPALRAALGL